MALRLSAYWAICHLLVLALCLRVSEGFNSGDIYEDKTLSYQVNAYHINKTITVHEGATLTVVPGVKIVFEEDVSLIVNGNLVANGLPESPIAISSLGKNRYTSLPAVDLLGFLSTRLVDGNGYNEGRLEVFHDGYWGTVCNGIWGPEESNVACRELGFEGGVSTRLFGAGTGAIWLDRVQCREGDIGLKSCTHRGFGVHSCSK